MTLKSTIVTFSKAEVAGIQEYRMHVGYTLAVSPEAAEFEGDRSGLYESAARLMLRFFAAALTPEAIETALLEFQANKDGAS